MSSAPAHNDIYERTIMGPPPLAGRVKDIQARSEQSAQPVSPRREKHQPTSSAAKPVGAKPVAAKPMATMSPSWERARRDAERIREQAKRRLAELPSEPSEALDTKVEMSPLEAPTEMMMVAPTEVMGQPTDVMTEVVGQPTDVMTELTPALGTDSTECTDGPTEMAEEQTMLVASERYEEAIAHCANDDLLESQRIRGPSLEVVLRDWAREENVHPWRLLVAVTKVCVPMLLRRLRSDGSTLSRRIRWGQRTMRRKAYDWALRTRLQLLAWTDQHVTELNTNLERLGERLGESLRKSWDSLFAS